MYVYSCMCVYMYKFLCMHMQHVCMCIGSWGVSGQHVNTELQDPRDQSWVTSLPWAWLRQERTHPCWLSACHQAYQVCYLHSTDGFMRP